jgi:hypothetical protein
MGKVGKAQLCSLLQTLHSQTMGVEDLVSSKGDYHPAFEQYMVELEVYGDFPAYQDQLRAAFSQARDANWGKAGYEKVWKVLDFEFNLEADALDAPTAPVFSPWAPTVQKSPIPENWTFRDGKLVRIDGDTSHIAKPAEGTKAARKGRAKADVDPCRPKGRFGANVAEVWYYDPDSGQLSRQVFTTGEAPMVAAYRRAREIQSLWHDRMGSENGLAILHGLHSGEQFAWVKTRHGDMKGNRHVHVAMANGILARPNDVVRIHALAKGMGIKAPVGETLCRTKPKHIMAMLVQNKLHKGEDHDLRFIETPCVEPRDNREIVYQLTFLGRDENGRIKSTCTALPLSDQKDDDGEVTLAGHKRRAYMLLLHEEGLTGAPTSVKYVHIPKEGDPQWFVISRNEAVVWDETRGEPEDEELVELHRAFTEGEIDDSEYVMKRGRRLMTLYPPDPYRGGSVTTSGQTNVNYNSDGTHNWQKAKNSGGPGTNWIGGMSYFEAQLYNGM